MHAPTAVLVKLTEHLEDFGLELLLGQPREPLPEERAHLFARQPVGFEVAV